MIHTILGAVALTAGARSAGVETLRIAPMGDTLLLAQAQLSAGRATDETISDVNSDLTCQLTVEMAGAEALVRWTVTGAVAIGLSPASAVPGGLTLVGERVVNVSELSWIHLTARDAAGERIRCSVMTGGSSSGPGTLSDPVTGAAAGGSGSDPA